VIDIGAPGPDRGEGGKYLIVPPGYDGPLPEGGFYIARAKTNYVLWFARSFLENKSDPKPVVALIRQATRVYPYEADGVGTSIAAFLAGTAKLGPVLDLGCGTGLVGVALMDMLGETLVGVDLSRRMLEEAGAKGLYSALRQEDLLGLLAEPGEAYDLVIAADVFCYLGRLDRVLALAAGRLAPQGLLIFSVERAPDGTGFSLHRQGRYAHARDLVEADLSAAGLRVVEIREEVLRHDLGRPVEGLLVVAGLA